MAPTQAYSYYQQYPSYPSYPSYPAASAPINMPRKGGYPPQPQYGPYSHISVSPPEGPSSVTTSGVPSYEPSATGSSYAGSASEYESVGTTSGVDLLEYMGDRLHGAFDPTPLDRSLAKQAQTSGELNAKTRQIMELQALAQQRLAATRANFADGIKTAREVQRDLDWTQKRVSSINQRAAKKYPKEYAAAQQRYPAPVDY